MGRRLWIAAMVTVIVACLAVPAGATDGAVGFQCCSYSPASVQITPGGSVTFTPGAGNSFSGGGSSSHPLMFVGHGEKDVTSGNAATAVNFATAGVYRFYCANHGSVDGQGNVHGMSGEVVVSANAPPSAAFTLSPATASAGQAVTLDAGASSDDHGISAYRWDFNGDGTIDETDPPGQPVTTHAFAQTANVVLTVVDDNAAQEPGIGDVSATVTHTVTVPGTPPPPVPTIPATTSTPTTTLAPPPPPPPPAPAPDRSAPHVTLTTPVLHLSVLRGGHAKLTFSSSESGSARLSVKAGSITIATATMTFGASGRHSLTLKLTNAGRTRLRHATKLSLRLTLVVRDRAGNAKTTSLTLVRVH